MGTTHSLHFHGYVSVVSFFLLIILGPKQTSLPLVVCFCFFVNETLLNSDNLLL